MTAAGKDDREAMTGPLTAFIEEAYQETLGLMTELRDYLAALEGDGGDTLDPQMRTRVLAEISSMTRYMTEAMAWLLLQKAAAAGEITPGEAKIRAEGLLEAEDAPRPPEADATSLPIEVRGYMDRSRRMYDQINKLRDSVDRTTV